MQKINQKNTWELKLIDHLSEIIEAESEENNAETNFQKVKSWFYCCYVELLGLNGMKV